MPFRVSKEHFERITERALQTLPEEFRRFLTNITLTIEDYPSKEDAGRLTTNRALLLGLFRGVPYPGKGGFFDIPHPMPDAIILFQKNIENICSTEQELEEQIRATLIHEVGHYFGMSEEDLRQYE